MSYDPADGSIHIHIRRWVVWWFFLGVVCGGIAIANILTRNLTREDEAVILLMGVLFWALGGLVCYACDGIRIASAPPLRKDTPASTRPEAGEWFAASEFILPGRKR
jgi:hypothetical protein